MEIKTYVHPDGTNFYQEELSIEQALKLAKIFTKANINVEFEKRDVTAYELISMLIAAGELNNALESILTAVGAPLDEERIKKLGTLKLNRLTQVFADFFTLNPGNTVLFGSTATLRAVRELQETLKNTGNGQDQNSRTSDQKTETKEVPKPPSVN